MQKPYFSSLGGSQDDLKRFRKASKRHLKSFKTLKKRVPKMEPEIEISWASFGADLGTEKWNENHVICLMSFSVCL